MTKTSWDKASGRAHGYDVVQLGYNYRGTELTAALGLIQLRKLKDNNESRRQSVARYRRLLAEADLPLTIPFSPRLADSAHHVFPVVLDDPAMVAPLREALTELNVQTTHHYPPVHTFSHYQQLAGDLCLPITEDVSAREVTLPLHPLLTSADIEEIVRRLCRAIESLRATPSERF